jgi:DnaK suppressor protein
MAQKAIQKKPAARKAPVAAKAPVAKKSVKPAAPARPAPKGKAATRAKPAHAAPAAPAAHAAHAASAAHVAPAARKPTASKPAATKAAAAQPSSARAPSVKPTHRAAAEPLARPAVAPAPVLAAKPSEAPPTANAGQAKPAPPPRKSGRSAAKYAMAQPPMPLPAPTSRFADRFAPPRPPTRQMNNLEVDQPRHAHKSDPKLANAWKSKAGHDLTEDEVLAMPESEYMNEKQLEFFRTKLQQLKDDLLSNAGETTEHLREDTSIVPDPADRATIEEEHALELRTRDRERKLLKKISQSLARIDSGEYGFCDETGEPIGLGRLIARPTATLSLEAQQRRELKQKMFGD